MDNDAQIRSLLEEVLVAERTPEEVCVAHPEHLGEVRRRWGRIRDLAGDLERMFPSSGLGWAQHTNGRIENSQALPQIPGYELEAIIGHGGMGVVYRARHIKLDRVVAVKMLRGAEYAPARELAALMREAQAIAGLKHPHIVQVHDAGELNGLPYFTMELVEGGSLAQCLAGVPQAAMRSAEWASALAHAVHAAHECGVVHRDLKPANVLVSADGTLKIADFGLARRTVGDGEGVITIAARVGTPSYMPPEQALGNADALRPTADVYSLGAILYEMLTGRPPFRGESRAETERQVLHDEPVPPSRLNPRTPIDLQTICLRCLQKSPERRYPSARALAEDLDRYQNGEPIQARPVGIMERGLKWVRRRPTQAALLAAALFVVVSSLMVGLWYHDVISTRRAELAVRESEAQKAVISAKEQVAAAIKVEAWNDADRILSHARERSVEANSIELDREIALLAQSVRIAQTLEQTRQSRVIGEAELKAVTDSYAAAFREMGVEIDSDSRVSGAAIRLSPIRTQLIAALDDWASVEYDLHSTGRCEMLLAIAREADPGSPWTNRFRTQALWSNREALLQLAVDLSDPTKAPNAPSAQQVGLLGLRLSKVGEQDVGMELLKRVLIERPTDFWMNWELGLAYLKAGRFREAISPTRTAMAIRPENAYACAFLAGVLSEAGDLDEGIPLFHHAIALAPDTRFIRRNLVYILCKNGRLPEARSTYSWWKQLDPQGVNALRQFIWPLLDTRRYEEALGVIREIRNHDTTDTGVLEEMGECLYELGRYAEAEAAFREDIRLQPNYGYPHSRLCRILCAAGRFDDAIAEAQAALLKSFKIASLYPPLGELLLGRGRAPEALAAFEQVVRESPSDVGAWIGLARAQLGLQQYDKARAAIDHAGTLSPSPEQQQQLARLKELYDRVSGLAPDLLSSPSPALDAETLQDLAEWQWRCAGNPSLAVRQYQMAFAVDPQLMSVAGSRSRFYAACAALAATEPPPSITAGLAPEECSRLQALALDWLSFERDALFVRRDEGGGPERVAVADEFRLWLAEPAIAIACNAAENGPVGEEDRWQRLWNDVKKGASLDNPEALLTKARVSVSLSDWSRASEFYSELFGLQPDQAGDVWFERAAVQLLANDLAGYRQTCTRMLDSQGSNSRIRAYHVARACTLAPLGDSDLLRAAEIGAREIRTSDAAWALTEKGALFCRANQSDAAIGLLKRSIEIDPQVGMAVLNWFWLAITNAKAGNPTESRRWFAKADTWLQRLDGERPPGDGPSAIHVHNWLEAHILHREAAEIVASLSAAH